MSEAVTFAFLVVLVVPAAAQQGAAAPFEAPPEWRAGLQAELERAEYRFQPVHDEVGVWSAPNRGQELRSRVSAAGLELFPRSVGASGLEAPWTLALATVGFGRAGQGGALAPARLSVAAERVELDHGPLVEWFVNRAHGIEQGWTIAARPSGAGELWIGLEFGGLAPRIEDGARSALLVDARGEVVLRYRDLHVHDASGRELPAWLRPSPTGPGIAIDDAGASYPLTVDPVLTGPAWTAESDQGNALFGISVASAGDVNDDGYSDVIVGAHAYDNGQPDEGRAFVFLGSAAGVSTLPSWTGEVDLLNAQFGFSVATAGDINGDGFSDVIVGAFGQSSYQGAAYAYMGSASGLGTSPTWTVAGAQTGGQFGYSVASAGDVDGDGYCDVIVVERGFSNGEPGEGRALVYMGSPTGLGTTAAWTAEGNQVNALLASASAAGDVNGDGYGDILTGAIQYSSGQSNEGRAYLYLGSSSGLGSTPSWSAESDQPFAFFGFVAAAGDINGDGYADVMVGAASYDNGQTDEGRAYLYLGSSTGVAASPAWTAEGDVSNAFFGAVASAGDVNGDGYDDVIVGAHGGFSGLGRAYLYLGSATGLSASSAWIAVSDQVSAMFGSKVAAAGDVNGDGFGDVVVGAHLYTNGQTNEGRAYVFHGSPTGLAPTHATSLEGEQTGAAFGTVLASAGDVNGDGYGDMLVSAPFFDAGQVDEGAVFVFTGASNFVFGSPAATLEANQAGAQFGAAISSAGDVNGDGYDDVLVGAPLYDDLQLDEGRVFVHLGSPAGLAALPAWSYQNDLTDHRLGLSVSAAGDVNGDGYGDVLVGACDDTGSTDQQRAYAFLGSPVGLAAAPSWVAQGAQPFSFFGYSVAKAGDVNGDGYGDVLVGAYLYDNGEANEGRAYAYLGSPSGLAPSPAWQAESNSPAGSFGFAVAGASDVNGDGFSDVLVSAYTLSNGETLEGRVYGYLGSASGLSASAGWTAESNQAGAIFGRSIASAGDVNGDGYADVLVGARAFDAGETNEGRAFCYLGSASGLAATPDWTVESNQASAELGFAVAGAGDVNGDGYDDALVGAPFWDGGQTDEGRVWLHLGNGGGAGRVRKLQQRTRAGARPLALVGSIGTSGLFRIRCESPQSSASFLGASALTAEAWLEWEVKPLGVPFDGNGIRSGTAQALVPGGGTLVFDELASIDDAAGHARTTRASSYHWRARVATNDPLFAHTAWFSAQGSHVTEAQLRKPAQSPH